MVGVAQYTCGHTDVADEPWSHPLLCPICGGEQLSSRAMRASEAPEGDT